jgi:hypothetical protein
MAVAYEMRFKGGTLEQYDKVVELMGYERGGPGEPGGLFHWVEKTDEGLRIVDVWQTDEAFQRFGAEKLRPLTAEVGWTGEPDITRHEVHNYLVAGSAVAR